MHVALVICSVCGSVSPVEYKTRRPTKCKEHADNYARPQKAANCAVCGISISRQGKGEGMRKYCADHTLALMSVDELREVYKQYPQSSVWQMPTYYELVAHLIEKRPRQ